MSYDIPNISVADSRPYFLYLFADGLTTTRLTSDPVDQVVGGFTYVASPIDGSDVEVTGSIEKQSIELIFPLSDTFARVYLDVATAITTLTVYRLHHSDLTNEVRVHWKGRVVGAKSGKQTIKMSVESIFTSMRRPGCRARYQRTCRHTLYMPTGCNISRAPFETAATVTATSGLVLTIPAMAGAAADDYKGGLVNWGGIFGMVESHSGSAYTLLTDIPGLADYVDDVGPAAVLMAPGCNRRSARCNSRFANSLNFGGFENLPDVNPFNTSII